MSADPRADANGEAPHFPGIDGLRALAVFVVIAYHCFVPRFDGGFFGVDVFFVISGFVITLTLLRRADLTGRVDRRAFYLRRVFRLVPALMCMIVFGAVTEVAIGGLPLSGYLADAGKCITFTYNLFQAADHGRGLDLSHTWSLGVEEQFYLVWAPLFALVLATIAVGRRTVVVAALAVAFYATEVLTSDTLGVKVSFFLPWSRFDEFLIGAALALLLHDHPTSRLTLVLRRGWIAGAASAGLLAAVLLHPGYHLTILTYFGYAGVALLTALVIGPLYLCAGVRTSIVMRTYESAPLVWLGRRSYGIYLYHAPVLLTFVILAGLHWIPCLLVTSVVTTLVAAVSYRFVERPAIGAGHAWLAHRARERHMIDQTRPL